ncbi:flj37770 protein [Echinococcus multilocularis]|uniref:Flj37770 protein n=1 Tax=Echinococcus multilocularis TaxID=6211 RepID=A0A068Y3G6_ECHMU|nr:flj37770 protein [Echinococcus multilocularis]
MENLGSEVIVKVPTTTLGRSSGKTYILIPRRQSPCIALKVLVKIEFVLKGMEMKVGEAEGVSERKDTCEDQEPVEKRRKRDSNSNVIAQRTCIKYLAHNGYTATKTLEIIQKAFGDHALSKTRVFHWYKMFRAGRERVENEPRSSRLSTSTNERHVAQVRDLVINNSRITIRNIIEQVPISFGSCQSIPRNHLGLRQVTSQVSPKTVNFLQQKQRSQATEMLYQGES